MLCVKCKKRTAVVFVSRIDGENKPVNEGYCLRCAKDMGIPQVTEMIKGMGMTEEDLDQFADEFDQMSEQLGLNGDELDSQTAPSLPPFFSKMFGLGKENAEEAPSANEKKPGGKEKKKEKEKKRKMLDQFGVNLTARARREELDPVVGRELELRAANIPFDETDSELMELFKSFLRRYDRGDEPERPTLAEKSEKSYTLPELEQYYRKLDLYFSFCKAFSCPVDAEELHDERERTAELINGILLYNLKNNISFCSRCGAALPLHHKGRLCNNCFNKRHGGFGNQKPWHKK